MRLPEIAIRRPVLAGMMSLALVVFGVIGLWRLPVRELPDIDPPIVNVTTVYPGANAAVMETQVTEPLEEAINGIEGIKTLTSESREQLSRITVEFTLARDIDVAAQDVRDRVSRARGRLPDHIEEPIIAKQDADAQPVMWIALHSDRFSTLELTSLAENVLKDRLQTLPGVSSILIGGAKRFAIRLWLDADRMAAHGVTVSDVEDALRTQSVELPSGRVENLQRELSIETQGELKTPQEYERLVIRNEGGALVRLADIGGAEVGVEDERAHARYNSEPAVGLGVVKQSKANTIEVAKGVKRELERLRPVLPPDLEIYLPYDESVFIERSITEVWQTLAIAFVLVVLSIFVFLHNVRSTFVPSITIPIALVAVFGVFYVMGFSINTITMLALVLAIGLVVDDTIVVLENIYRHIQEGMPPMQAAFTGMKEITFAVLATTIALVAVFLPLAFQTSVTGRLFVEFAVAICFAVIISTFVALTLAPMLCARILRPFGDMPWVFRVFERGMKGVTDGYGRWLRGSLRHPFIVLAIAAGSFILALGLGRALSREFLPEEDKGRLFCILIAPEGSTSEYTDRMVRKMEQILRETPEVDGYFSAVALARGGPGASNEGLAFVRLKDGPRRHVREILEGPGGLRARFFSEIEGALAIPIVPKAIGRGFGQEFQLVLQSQDLGALNEEAQAFSNRLRELGFLQGVRSSFELTKPELRVRIDRDRAAALGISVERIARTLQVLFGGTDLAKVKLGGKEYDVIAQLGRASRLTPQDLGRLYVRSDRGELVQLAGVVRYETGSGPNKINHYNRLRAATIEGSPVGLPLGTVMDRVKGVLREELPPAFRYEWAGEAKDLEESGYETLFVMLLAILIVYMVLAAQFESLVHPLTVLLSLPLAAIGALGSLWLLARAGVPAMGINLFSQIGLVLLIGLVTKNAILLVEFANQRMAAGMSAQAAMLEAGRIRLRPILMTTISTVIGIMPIAIGFGAGAESRRPLGVAAVGGMATSALLTLFVIPVVYVLLSRARDRLLGGRGAVGANGRGAAARELEPAPVPADGEV
ncbi:MAG TPA: efflux RND transporter permease subunit [bacterium]